MLLHVITLLSVIVSITVAAETSVEIVLVSSPLEFAVAKFVPKEVTIKVNDIVKWTQTVAFQTHTATSSDVTKPEFNSGLMLEGATFSHNFTRRGTFEYYCILNPATMLGTIKVE